MFKATDHFYEIVTDTDNKVKWYAQNRKPLFSGPQAYAHIKGVRLLIKGVPRHIKGVRLLIKGVPRHIKGVALRFVLLAAPYLTGWMNVCWHIFWGWAESGSMLLHKNLKLKIETEYTPLFLNWPQKAGFNQLFSSPQFCKKPKQGFRCFWKGLALCRSLKFTVSGIEIAG